MDTVDSESSHMQIHGDGIVISLKSTVLFSSPSLHQHVLVLKTYI